MMNEITVAYDYYAVSDQNKDALIQVDLFQIADGVFVRHIYKNRTDAEMLLESGYMLSMAEINKRVPVCVWLNIHNQVELKTVVLGYMKPEDTAAKLHAAAVLCKYGMIHIDIPPLVELKTCEPTGEN